MIQTSEATHSSNRPYPVPPWTGLCLEGGSLVCSTCQIQSYQSDKYIPCA